MTLTIRLLVELQKERQRGNISGETEQHLKHEFRKLGRDASLETLARAVRSESDRLEREAALLRQMEMAILSGL
jgi:hypothetical protein